MIYEEYDEKVLKLIDEILMMDYEFLIIDSKSSVYHDRLNVGYRVRIR